MITFYDFVTTVVMLSLFLLWTISIIVLFKKEMSTEVSQVLFRLSRWENLEYAKKI